MPKAPVNGIELAYDVRGQGHPLVLVHFSSGSKEMWEEQTGPFSERYRVVAYDVRGHGESDAPPDDDPGYAMANLVEDQRALMEHLGIEQAYVLGISMGGAIALPFALRHPELVRALLLCDTTAEMGDTAADQYRRVDTDRDAVKAYLREKGLDALSRKTWLEWAGPLGIARPEDLPAPAKQHIARVRSMSIDGFLGTGAALRDHHALDRVAEITAPALILSGEHDFLRRGSEQMKERLPEARYTVIKGAAHISSFWEPESFAAAVLDFLADVEAGRPVGGCEER